MFKKVMVIAILAAIFYTGSSLRVYANSTDEGQTKNLETGKKIDRDRLIAVLQKKNESQVDFRDYDPAKKSSKSRGFSTKKKIALGAGIAAAVAVIVIAVGIKNFEPKVGL